MRVVQYAKVRKLTKDEGLGKKGDYVLSFSAPTRERSRGRPCELVMIGRYEGFRIGRRLFRRLCYKDLLVGGRWTPRPGGYWRRRPRLSQVPSEGYHFSKEPYPLNYLLTKVID
jgi:hypothetical protein